MVSIPFITNYRTMEIILNSLLSTESHFLPYLGSEALKNLSDWYKDVCEDSTNFLIQFNTIVVINSKLSFSIFQDFRAYFSSSDFSNSSSICSWNSQYYFQIIENENSFKQELVRSINSKTKIKAFDNPTTLPHSTTLYSQS